MGLSSTDLNNVVDMDIEAETRTNTRDIQQLAVSLTRLTTIVENSEKRHDSDMDTIKAAVQGIEQLNQRMSTTISMEKDISSLKDSYADLKGDVRTVTHDVRSLTASVELIADTREKLSTQATKIEALEKWRDEIRGATGATKVFANVCWSIFGGAVIAGGYFIAKLFFTHDG